MSPFSLAAGLLLFLPGFVAAQTRVPPGEPLTSALRADPPVVVELFTSQGLFLVPTGDALAAELADRPDLLVLTFHVTYWNSLGWKDPFSLEAATERQRRYVALSVSPQVYTPAMVVDGRLDAVGSDRPAVQAALAQARAAGVKADGMRANRAGSAEVDVIRRGETVSVSVGAGTGTAKVLLLGFDRMHQTAVGRGENGGRTLREANIVRSIINVGNWTGGRCGSRCRCRRGRRRR